MVTMVTDKMLPTESIQYMYNVPDLTFNDLEWKYNFIPGSTV